MKKALCLFLILTLCSLTFTSCADETTSESDEYLNGRVDGHRDIFLDLWSASSLDCILSNDELWETEHFSLVLTDGIRQTDAVSAYDESIPYIKYSLTLKNGTIEEYFDESKMFFNIYSVNDTLWEEVLGGDFYYDYALIEGGIDGQNAIGKVDLYNDVKRLAIIIVIDGSIYKASYYISQ